MMKDLSSQIETRPEQLQFEDWGLVEYELALKRQLNYVEEVQKGERPSTLIFCSHPPIVTLGRAADQSDYKEWQGPVASISRGGRATYHGPSQLVVYPIMDLNLARGERKPRDIVGFLRDLENGIIDSLATMGVPAEGRSLKKKEDKAQATEETGVWVKDRKLASLGIAVKRWVSFHGAAINVDQDPTAFLGLKPCGFQPSVMISLEELTGQKIDRTQYAQVLKKALIQRLS